MNDLNKHMYAESFAVRPRYLEVQESLGTRLAADIDGVVRVGESIKLGGRALSVGSHVLKVEPVTNIEDALEVSALANLVDAITSRAPDGVLDAIAR